ncbi:MAG: GMC family oxidoreductase [Pseudomonadota bacterium]
MKETQFDAIVVGSGISGGWAAKELAEKGLKVLVLERGRDIRHARDYLGEHAGTWQMPYYGLPDRELVAREYPIQGDEPAFSHATLQYWNKDRENPYIRNEEKPFKWVRADMVGGRSVMWGRQTYRFAEQDFRANEQDGHGIPWPVRYDDIAPWYSYVEKFAGISGEARGFKQLPDSEFLPPMDYFAIEKTALARIAEKLPEVTPTIGRVAILTQNHMGRAACHYCGPCERGCSSGSYFSSQSSTLPAAQATGNMTLLSDMVVTQLEHDETGRRITAVSAVNTRTRERVRFSSKLVFLCASTVASTQLMLNSASDKHPAGLSNQSGALGHYLMDHAMIRHIGLMVDNVNSYYEGERPNGLYIPRFRNNFGQDEDADFVRGFGYQCMPLRMDWQSFFNRKGFGADYKDALIRPQPFWIWALGGFMECLPYRENKVFLDKQRTDRFGVPLVSTEFSWGENELAMARDTAVQAARIYRAAGALYWQLAGEDELSEGGQGIHEMGTARMGHDPKESVLNQYNQAHEVDNLFVTDGSFMTSAACVNPSLTYMAFTARAVDYAVKRLNEGALS